jgi:hypothetical protein
MIALVPCRLARERRPPSDSRRRRTEGQLNRHSFPYESRRDTTRSLPTFASLLIPEREEIYKVGRNSPSAVDPVAFEMHGRHGDTLDRRRSGSSGNLLRAPDRGDVAESSTTRSGWRKVLHADTEPEQRSGNASQK